MKLFGLGLLYPEEKPELDSSCEICRSWQFLQIDHDHQTGYCRGTLCSSCNNNVKFFERGYKNYLNEEIITYLDLPHSLQELKSGLYEQLYPFMPVQNFVPRSEWGRRVRSALSEVEFGLGYGDEFHEIVELSFEQLGEMNDDDWQARRNSMRLGREKVYVFGLPPEEGEMLYPARTPDQFALEEGLQPLLDSALTGEQRVLVRWRYAAMYTERQIAALLNVSQPAIHQRLETIHRRLRAVLTEAFTSLATGA